MKSIIAFLALCILSIGALAQQGIGPQRKVWLGPSVGEQFAVGCSATGTSPQTCNGAWGKVTTGTLTTAAATAATFTINNSSVSATSWVSCQLNGYSGTVTTNGWPEILYCTPGAGTITVTFLNGHATAALSGTLTIGFDVTD